MCFSWYRSGDHNCNAGHYLLDVTGYCSLLEQEHSVFSRVPSILWCNWSSLLLSIPCEISRRGVGTHHALLIFHDNDVRVALWYHKEVWVWCRKQGLYKLALESRPFLGDCSRPRDWSDTYRAYVWDSSNFLSLCHQSTCISPGISSTSTFLFSEYTPISILYAFPNTLC